MGRFREPPGDDALASVAPGQPRRAHRTLGVLVTALALIIATPYAMAGFTTTNPEASPSVLAAVDLDTYLPASVSVSGTSGGACTVSWTAPAAGLTGLTYQVDDGTSVVSSGLTALTASLPLSTASWTPRVRAVYRTWVSRNAVAAPTPCTGIPDAPPAVSATPSDGTVVATWSAPAANGSVILGYTATLSPGGQTCTALLLRTCTFTGLVNGTTYTTSVSARNANGTGPAATSAGVIPYPSSIMTSSATRLWLDAADRATLLSSSTCTGAAAATGGRIGCWADKSAYAGNAVQPTSTNQAVVSSLNGNGSATFDGVGTTYALDPAKLPTGTTPSTVFAVAMQEDPAPNSSDFRGLLAWGGTSTGSGRQLYKDANSSRAVLDSWGAAGAATKSWDTGAATLVDGTLTSSSILVAVNGATSFTYTSANNTGASIAKLGGILSATSGYTWSGRVAEVIVLSSLASTTERRSVQEYLARKWAITLTPGVAPNAPTAVVLTPTTTSVGLTWSAPTWDGGSAVTDYTVQWRVAGTSTWTTLSRAASTATSATITGLSAGTTIDVQVLAVNTNGTSPASPVASVSTLTTPTAPQTLSASAADSSSTISWAAPASSGGSPVTSYSVTATPGTSGIASASCTTTTTSCSLTGLTNGVAYAVSVTAINAQGTGPAAASVSVTPYPATILTAGATGLWLDGADPSTLLSSPTCAGPVATAGSAVGCWKDKSANADHATSSSNQATVSSLNSRTAPAFDGATTSYSLDITSLPTGTATSTVLAVATQDDLTPLLSGARSVIGWGALTTGGARLLTKGANTANAYLDTSGTAGSMSPTRGWSTLAATIVDATVTSTGVTSSVNGASNYTYTAATTTGTSAGARLGSSPGGSNFWQGRIAEVIVLSGTTTAASLRTMQEYLARKWGVTITPQAPTALSSAPNGSSIAFSWSAPAWNGGATVTSYTVSAVPTAGGTTLTCTSTTTSCTISGAGTGSYTVTVTATNSAGTGPASTSITATTRSITGTVFEDVNYTGGAGRSLSTAAGVGIPNARVELYDAAGAFISATTTSATGTYAFGGVSTTTTHLVRVVGATVTSTRPNANSSVLPVLTYAVNSPSGTASAVTDMVGGLVPAATDPAAGATGTALFGASCATEGGTCAFTGTRLVRYGETGSFVYRWLTGGTACNNTVFGDPLVGTVKRCWLFNDTYQNMATVRTGTSGIAGIDFGFNANTVVNTNASGAGSLRQVITNANILGGETNLQLTGRTLGAEHVVWMISNGTTGSGGSLSLTGGLRTWLNYLSGGVFTISPTATTLLPAVASPLVIDAQTQPSWSTSPLVVLSGAAASGASSATGISCTATCTLRGLLINAFTGRPILLSGAPNSVIQGVWTGVTTAGTVRSQNGSGVAVTSSPSTTIGGTTSAARTVISGAGGDGLTITSSNNTSVTGTFIGTTTTAGGAIGNLGNGITVVSSSGLTIGAAGTNGNVVISGNSGAGIEGSGMSTSTVTYTTIGRNAGNTTDIPNTGAGIVLGGNGNTIGGTASGVGNVIAANGTAGTAGTAGVVVKDGATANAILGNAIDTNVNRGIDLGADGATANDGITDALKANNSIDTPVITSSSLSGSSLTVAGYVGTSGASPTFSSSRVEIFAADASTPGQGRTYVGSLTTATTSSAFSGVVTVPAGVSIVSGTTRLVATATDSAFNTSEFSASVTVGVAPSIPVPSAAPSAVPSAAPSPAPLLPSATVAYTTQRRRRVRRGHHPSG